MDGGRLSCESGSLSIIRKLLESPLSIVRKLLTQKKSIVRKLLKNP